MANPKEDASHLPEAQAVADLRKLRDRLAELSPDFKLAIDIEEEAESFCREVRADLRRHRKLKKLEQSAMAQSLDMSQPAISKIETAEGDLGLKTVFRYARALGLHPVCVFVPAVEEIFAGSDIVQSQNDPRAASARASNAFRAALAFQKAEVGLIRDMSKSVSDAMAGLVREIE